MAKYLGFAPYENDFVFASYHSRDEGTLERTKWVIILPKI